MGAGNKKGVIRPNFTDYVTGKDIQDYMNWVLKNYKKNPRLAQWFGDHMFGKAMQPVEGTLTGELILQFDKTFNAPNTPPETTSGSSL